MNSIHTSTNHKCGSSGESESNKFCTEHVSSICSYSESVHKVYDTLKSRNKFLMGETSHVLIEEDYILGLLDVDYNFQVSELE